jgi:uncharacterized protein YjdB
MSSTSTPRSRGGSLPYRLAGIGRLTTLAVFASLAACSDAGTGPGALAEEQPADIVLSSTELNLTAGDTARIQAVLVNSSGVPIASPSAGTAKAAAVRVSWESSNPQIVDISRSGLVLARQSGTTTVTASSGNLKRQSEVKVTGNGNNRTVVISPAVDTLGVGQERQFSASVLNNGGNPTNEEVSWEALNPSIADVDSFGRVLAKAIGIAVIVASGGGSADSATVVVIEPVQQASSPAPSEPSTVPVASVSLTPQSAEIEVGKTAQFTASLRDADNNVLTGRTIEWWSSNNNVASVNSSGLVTAKASGLATITATSEGVSGSAVVAVPEGGSAAGDGTSFPNQPSGFRILQERPFATTTEGGWGAQGRFSIRSDVAAPFSAPTIGEMRFEKDHQRGTGAGMTWRYFDPSRELYVSYWLKLSETFTNNFGNGTKVFFGVIKSGIDCKDSGKFFNTVQARPGESEFSMHLFAQAPELHANMRFVPNRESVIMRRGQWYFVEHVLVGNTPGKLDGEVHGWINGRKIIEYGGIGWVRENSSCADAGKWFRMHWNPTWGNPNDDRDLDLLRTHAPFSQYIDHLYISGR